MTYHKFKVLLLIFLFLTIISGCATVSRRTELLSSQEAYLTDLCDRHKISCQWDSVSQVVTLKHGGMSAKALVGSDIVLVGEVSIGLSAPVKMVESSIVVPSDFKAKVINQFKRKIVKRFDYTVAMVREVIIDAGHGGKDPGAIGRTGLQEKRVVLDVAKRLKKLLEKEGLKVRMTRDRDEFISLKERTEITSRSRADLFISIHANSSPVRSVHGMEIFMAKNLDPLEKNEVQRRENQGILFDILSMKTNNNDLKKIVAGMLYDHKQAESRVLAEKVLKNTSKFVKTKNRGLKSSRFFVLRNTLIPAVLVEVGFLTNPKEERLLETSAYRQKMARGLAKSVMEYVNGQ